MDSDTFMEYPYFQIVPSRGVIPAIILPRDYQTLVPKFYEDGGREEITRYVSQLEEVLKNNSQLNLPIRLQWHPQDGLTNISVGYHGGLDLNKRGWHNFQEHNLGLNSGIVAAMVATNYIRELLKQRSI